MNQVLLKTKRDEKRTGMKMKENVEQTLIAPRDVVLVRVVEGLDLVDEAELAHARQVHEHDARVEAERAVVRMPRESIVPAHVRVLVFGRERRQLRAVE